MLSEAYKHRLRLQQNSPGLLDTALDFLFESDHISGFCGATIDECQRMLVGDAYRARRIALNESRVLDQPGCRDFVLGFERRVAGNLQAPFRCLFLQLRMLISIQHRVLEKRSGTAAIFILGPNQHPLAGADLANCFSRLRQSGSSTPSRKISLEIGVCDLRLSMKSQTVTDSQNDVASPFRPVEDARAVLKTAFLFGQFH